MIAGLVISLPGRDLLLNVAVEDDEWHREEERSGPKAAESGSKSMSMSPAYQRSWIRQSVSERKLSITRFLCDTQRGKKARLLNVFGIQFIDGWADGRLDTRWLFV